MSRRATNLVEPRVERSLGARALREWQCHASCLLRFCHGRTLTDRLLRVPLWLPVLAARMVPGGTGSVPVSGQKAHTLPTLPGDRAFVLQRLVTSCVVFASSSQQGLLRKASISFSGNPWCGRRWGVRTMGSQLEKSRCPFPSRRVATSGAGPWSWPFVALSRA